MSSKVLKTLSTKTLGLLGKLRNAGQYQSINGLSMDPLHVAYLTPKNVLKCIAMLKELKSNKLYADFFVKLNARTLREYGTSVKKYQSVTGSAPIDFGAILQKLKQLQKMTKTTDFVNIPATPESHKAFQARWSSEHYGRLVIGFIQEVAQVLRNALCFNPPDHEIHLTAVTAAHEMLEIHFPKLRSKLLVPETLLACASCKKALVDKQEAVNSLPMRCTTCKMFIHAKCRGEHNKTICAECNKSIGREMNNAGRDSLDSARNSNALSQLVDEMSSRFKGAKGTKRNTNSTKSSISKRQKTGDKNNFGAKIAKLKNLFASERKEAKAIIADFDQLILKAEDYSRNITSIEEENARLVGHCQSLNTKIQSLEELIYRYQERSEHLSRPSVYYPVHAQPGYDVYVPQQPPQPQPQQPQHQPSLRSYRYLPPHHMQSRPALHSTVDDYGSKPREIPGGPRASLNAEPSTETARVMPHINLNTGKKLHNSRHGPQRKSVLMAALQQTPISMVGGLKKDHTSTPLGVPLNSIPMDRKQKGGLGVISVNLATGAGNAHDGK